MHIDWCGFLLPLIQRRDISVRLMQLLPHRDDTNKELVSSLWWIPGAVSAAGTLQLELNHWNLFISHPVMGNCFPLQTVNYYHILYVLLLGKKRFPVHLLSQLFTYSCKITPTTTSHYAFVFPWPDLVHLTVFRDKVILSFCYSFPFLMHICSLSTRP